MTLTELQDRKTLYMAAEAAILQGQEYRIRDGVIDRYLKRADLEQIRTELTSIDRQIEALTAEGARTRRVLYLR